jgi:retron-type reverse transcriptase
METFTIEELFQAYFDCRKSKRSSPNALAFELGYEEELLRLHKELNDGSYTLGPSVAFIVTQPVKREIFAAQFRDRVVHHLLINRLNPLFEKTFIYDSYACREGKGTLFGVNRVADFIRRCSNNYSRDCYILKLDIQGFFMNIHREVLLRRLNEYISRQLPKITWDVTTIFLDTLKKVVLANPADNCWLKSKLRMWEGLPVNKSILKMNGMVDDPSLSGLPCNVSGNKVRGLPIGNLTSQVFANFYLHAMDAFIMYKLLPQAAPRGYYGRYVDDFVLIHSDKEYLKSLVKPIGDFLKKELLLQLHPRKINLQHYTKGLSFLGTFIQPHIILPGKRMQGNFYAKTVQLIERHAEQQVLTEEELQQAQATVNSYFGIIRHLRSRHLRKKVAHKLRKSLAACFRITPQKIAIRKKGRT